MSSSFRPSLRPTVEPVQESGEDQVSDQRRTAIICAVVGSLVFVTVFVVIFAWRKKEAWRRMKELKVMNRQEVSLPLSRTNSRSGDSNDASAAHLPSSRLSPGGVNVGTEQQVVPRKSGGGNSTLNPMMTRQAASRASKKSPSIVHLIENHIPFQFCELQDAIPRRDSNIFSEREAMSNTKNEPENPKSSL